MTEELDAGPIIAQETVPVDHTKTVTELIDMGRELETVVLRRAVDLHVKRRIIVDMKPHHRALRKRAARLEFSASTVALPLTRSLSSTVHGILGNKLFWITAYPFRRAHAERRRRHSPRFASRKSLKLDFKIE